jgi:single-strand DNA-binding protein
MSNEIRITGNLGKNPEQKTVAGKTVTEFTLFCDEYRYVEEKKEYVENGGDWYRVTVWNKTLADATFTTLRQGARVVVSGHLKLNRYKDSAGVEQVSLDVSAEDVAHKLNRVEQVVMRKQAEPTTA